MWPRNLTLVFALVLALAPRAFALSISNVVVVNVTPGSFSVLWRSPAGTEPGISLFADAAGTASLNSQLGVEVFPLHTGSPDAANGYERRQSKSAIQSKMRGYGLMLARVTRCRPNTTYYFRLTATGGLPGQYPESGPLPSVTTPVENSFVAESLQLLLEVPGVDNRGRVVTLAHTNAAHPLAAVVGDGSGTNQVLFSLSDLFALAGQGNYMPLGEQEFALDLLGGQPGDELSERIRMTFTGAFLVGYSVSNSFSIEFLALSIGSSIVRVGQTGSVPLLLNGNVRAAEILAELRVPLDRLGSLVVTNLHSSLASADVYPITESNAIVQFTAKENQSLSGGFELGKLQFLALSNHSAFVPLSFRDPLAIRGDSSSSTNISLQAGRVVVIGREPLIESISAAPAQQHRLMLYGNPWTGYALQYTTNLSGGWTTLRRWPLTNLFAALDGLPRYSPAMFYRALDLADDPPALEAHRAAHGGRSLILFGKPGAQYVLQSSPDLAAWTTLPGSYALTNSFRTIENLATNAHLIFYRARKN